MKNKTLQYEKFFQMLSWLAIAIKYYEHEKLSPGVMHILKYFWMEKLKVKIKSNIKELEEVEDLQEIIVEIIYEFIWEKQTEIMFKIDWKLQIVCVKHFIDHFVRILPDFKALHISSLKEHFTFKSSDKDKSTKIFSSSMINLQQKLNREIEDCIDSVSKLAPLVSWFIDFSSDEIGAASLLISIKHSIKTMNAVLTNDK